MEDRHVVVRESGNSVAALSLVAIVVIAALVALFIWQPWSGTARVAPGTSTSTSSGTSSHQGE